MVPSPRARGGVRAAVRQLVTTKPWLILRVFNFFPNFNLWQPQVGDYSTCDASQRLFDVRLKCDAKVPSAAAAGRKKGKRLKKNENKTWCKNQKKTKKILIMLTCDRWRSRKKVLPLPRVGNTPHSPLSSKQSPACSDCDLGCPSVNAPSGKYPQPWPLP